MPEPEHDERPPVVVRRGRERARLPAYTWLLLALIVLFFALGITLLMTGLLVPGQGVDPPPGPTAFTLTPQVTLVGTPLP